MSTQMVTFYGSKEDLDTLRNMLKKAGYEEQHDNIVRATDGHIPLPAQITFALITGVVAVIRQFMVEKSKRMVTREKFGEKITIKGNFPIEEVERLLAIPHSLNIEGDTEQKPAKLIKGMKHKEPVEMMLHPRPAIGGPLVTIEKTKEVVRWTSFDDKNQILTVIMPDGETKKINKRETRLATTEENLEFRKKNPTMEIG